ncbi:MAG: transglycosylase domain-containing protein [Bacteroidia bacterium]|nr:transglycosylase domain-containing protein [Bacteroidia bacterium]
MKLRNSHWLWISAGLSLGMLVSGIWMLRLSWLPWLLRFILSYYEIDRLRYESAEWNTLGHLFFHKITIQRADWTLSVDTLEVRLGAFHILRLKGGRVTHDSGSTQPASTGPVLSPPTLPLGRIYSLFKRAEQIDTLCLQDIELPHQICLSLEKHQQRWFLYVRRDTVGLRGYVHVRRDSGYFSFDSFHVEGREGSYIQWGKVGGSFEMGEDFFHFLGIGWGLAGFHKRIGSRPLRYDSAGIELHWYQTADSAHIYFAPRALPLQMAGQIRWHLNSSAMELQLTIPRQSHDAFLRAFPEGFLKCLSGAELQGTSTLGLVLRYDPSLPDTLQLEVDWQPKNFGILRWRDPSPLSLREPFEYRPYQSARQLWIGPENPAYLSFAQITPYVLHAVLHSEDGLFFYHNGFQKEHFLKALLENWRCQCFRRGAGTITMQVVRNLLLGREKTIARKVEEILLTALIERFHLLSKQRIAELYFNIVEWGPEVYGLTEATHFYFGKEPHEITIPEAIFLGTLLPSPKAYRYFIDRKSGCALPSLATHFRTIAHYLVHQHYLPQDSLETVTPERACLKGKAWQPDSLPPP